MMEEKMIKEKILEFISKNKEDHEKLEAFATFIDDYFPDEEKKTFTKKLNDALGEVDEDDVCEIIKELKRRDGTLSGMKWGKLEADSVATQYNLRSKFREYGHEYDCLTFWFAINYVYATHYNINRSLSGYVELAIDEIMNKNVCLEEYMKKMIEKIHKREQKDTLA